MDKSGITGIQSFGLVHYDFEDGMYHLFLLDIEQVFDTLSEELSGEALLLPLMRRFCNLFAYARMIRCIAEEIQDAPEWLCKLRNILQRKINFLEKNVDNSESI